VSIISFILQEQKHSEWNLSVVAHWWGVALGTCFDGLLF